MSDLPFVSVVVPTRDRSTLLTDCLESLAAQDYPKDLYEVIVVDDGSMDQTYEVVRDLDNHYQLPPIRYIRQGKLGVNAARNTGLRVAQSDLICFVDDDIDAPSSWLGKLVEGALRYPYAGCLGGPIRLRLEGKLPRMCGRENLGETEFDLGSEDALVPCVFGANMACRKKAVSRIGDFNEILSGPGDEEEWQLRLWARHGHVVYIHEAWLWHRRTAQNLLIQRLMKKRFIWGIKEIAYFRLVNRQVSPLHEVWGIIETTTHALRYRCAWGMFAASWHFGRVCGCIWESTKDGIGRFLQVFFRPKIPCS